MGLPLTPMVIDINADKHQFQEVGAEDEVLIERPARAARGQA